MLIDTQDRLDAFCETLRQCPFITVDTEFLREKTYYPVLCLIQAAGNLPGSDVRHAAAIDPLAPDLDLAPFLDLMRDPGILKVFHAARQDLEIFHRIMDEALPAPLFDTQIAAMVCGYGDSVGYEMLLRKLLDVRIDKQSRFTDWSRRPLSAAQIDYALGDVTHLADAYPLLRAELDAKERTHWLESEFAALAAPETYAAPPRDAWKRIKIRSDNPRVLAALRELAAWRETEARRKDRPKGWIIKDETLAQIALSRPETPQALAAIRGMSAKGAEGRTGQAILDAVRRAAALPKDALPASGRQKPAMPAECQPVLEMLRLLLRITCAEAGVVPRLVATPDDLERMAAADLSSAPEDCPAMTGWRYAVFGQEAQALKAGRIALAVQDGAIVRLPLSGA